MPFPTTFLRGLHTYYEDKLSEVNQFKHRDSCAKAKSKRKNKHKKK